MIVDMELNGMGNGQYAVRNVTRPEFPGNGSAERARQATAGA